MNEIVLVPAWRRPDFLWAALVRIWEARDREDIVVRVCLDRYASSETEWAFNRFNERVAEGKLQVRHQEPHRYRSNTINVMESYKEAVAEGFDMIHLVEDDVMVGYDYFDFHRRAHELAPEAFAVSACRNQQFALDADPARDDEAVYLHPSYQSLGVSFRREVLQRAVSGVGEEYYRDMVWYCGSRFPGSAIPAGHAEQDGFLNRQREAGGLATAYGATPRAYHAGFCGYNRRGASMTGPVEDRARKILTMSSQELNDMAHSYKDHVAIDLDEDRASVSRLVHWP